MKRPLLVTGLVGLAATFLFGGAPAPVHAQTRLLRQPTYFKGKVAFSYLGDIWIANDNGS